MKIDWNRVKRTFIQSAIGGMAALFAAIANDFSKESIITAIIGFAATIASAVAMNINNQISIDEEEDENE